MGNWWTIARLELTLALRDREAVIWSLIAPVIMAWVFGTVFDGTPPRPTSVSVDAGDNPAYVHEMFAGLLEKKGILIADDERLARVVVPDSLVAKLTQGEAVEARILKREASDLRVNQISVKVREVMYTLALRAKGSWLDSPPGEAEVASLVEAEGPMYLETRTLGRAPKAVGGMAHQLPAMLVMFLMFQLMTFFLLLWVEDIKTGKIKRIVMSPTPMRDLFAAQLASRMVWGLLQVLVILGIGSLVLGVRLEIPWGYFAVMLLAYMVTAISLGLLLATFFRTAEKANAIGVAVGLILAALGGCWWPLEVVSEPMRAVAMALPTGLMMDATGEFIALGKDAPFPTLNLTILLVMSAVMMPIAIRRMRRQIVA